MIFYNFGATTNYIPRRDYNARYVSTRRAFFMSESQVIDYNLCSAATLGWELSYPHLICSPCDGLVVGGEEGSRFFCPQLTTNPMSNPNQPAPTALATAIHKLEHYTSDYSELGWLSASLRQVAMSALNSDIADTEKITQVLQLAEAMLEVYQAYVIELYRDKN